MKAQVTHPAPAPTAPGPQRTRADRCRLALLLLIAAGLPVQLFAGETAPTGTRPVILEQPANQSVHPGADATFSVLASSTLAMSYQWCFQDRPIPGATQNTLRLYTVDAAQAGLYTVSVSNSIAGVWSSPATLRVLRPLALSAPEPLIIAADLTNAVSSALIVSNQVGTIDHLAVVLFGLTHTAPDDLDILLHAPQPPPVILLSDAGGNTPVDSLLLEISPRATQLPPDTNPIVTGAYLPANYPPDDDPFAATDFPPGSDLNTFLHSDPNGEWRLLVSDDTPGNGGLIQAGWGLELMVRLPEIKGFLVALRGDQLQPPVASSGSGNGCLELNPNGTLDYRITLNDLSGDFQSAHLHGLGDAGNYSSLFPLDFHPLNPRSGELRGTLTSSSAPQLWNLRRGLHYITVRTTAFPDGELRGPIVPVPPPAILEQPRSQVVAGGDPVTFSVLATNPAPVSYRWRHNQVPIPGATNATLTLSNVWSERAGFYDVSASNFAGTRFSRTAELIVVGGASFEWITIAPGTRGSYSFTDPAPPRSGHTTPCGWLGPSARWLGLHPGGAGRLILDTTGSTGQTLMALYFGNDEFNLQYLDCQGPDPDTGFSRWETAVTPDVPGVAVEVDRLAPATGPLRINWRLGWEPTIATPPADRVVAAGDIATFSVAATGLPPPSYQWYFENLELPGATNAAYTIYNAATNHSGHYRVDVRNFMGAETVAASLRVLAPPGLTQPRLAHDAFSFHVACTPGATLVIETSADLRRWSPIATNPAPTGSLDFVEPASGQPGPRFYRARSY